MILITHPRSGSEWFVTSVKDKTFNGQEVLTSDRFPDYPLYSLTPQQRLEHIARTHPATEIQKLHAFDVHRHLHQPTGWMLAKILANRKDLYYLERRNVRKTLISWLIAVFNRFYHDIKGVDRPIAQGGIVNYPMFLEAYTQIVVHRDWAKSAFRYNEMFVYEDILSGSQVPSTFEFDLSKSNVLQRNSMQYADLITNFDEVVRWMDDLNIPGDLHA